MVAFFLLFCSNAVGPILIVSPNDITGILQCLIVRSTPGMDVGTFPDARGARHRDRSRRYFRLSDVGVDV
jgi:hypothetical protein